MPKHVTLFASIQVVPIDTENPETHETEDGKQLIFSDPVSGEEILYPMGKDLTNEVRKKLGMSNRALQASLEEEVRRAQARQILAGANGAMPTQEEIDKLLREQQRREGH